MRRPLIVAIGVLSMGLAVGLAGPATASEAPATTTSSGFDGGLNGVIPIAPAWTKSGKVIGGQANALAAKELGVEWEQQINGYYCGPTATRMALKAKMGDPPSQDSLAGMLGTDQNGTDHVGLVKNVMNDLLNTGYYEDKYINYTPTQAQKDLFKSDVIYDVDRDWAIVANIWVVAGGPRPDGYPSGDIFHYVTVIGYSDDGNSVLVADPAAGRGGFANVPSKYWIGTDLMATLIGGKGYAA